MQAAEWLWLFFAWSFLGWWIEVTFTAARQKRYVDRGVLNGPLCVIYGVAGCIITAGARDLTESWFFLFIGSALVATVVEWIAGNLLERITHTRWWDYSRRPFNLDGYICLEASLVWGALGVFSVRWGNALLLAPCRLLPAPWGAVLAFAGVPVLALDALVTVLTLLGVHARLPAVQDARTRLSRLTVRLGTAIFHATERRMLRAVPTLHLRRRKAYTSELGLAAVFLLFFFGSLLGDAVETLFCYFFYDHRWSSRSSLVIGPFSVVWGLALALFTKLLYRYKDRSASFLFVVGVFLGGVYEYLCSVATEIFFGAVFWDYSAMPFNLGGRINLLYCIFWGFASVAWFKAVYPPLARLLQRFNTRKGRVLTAALAVFMAADIALSAAALVRCNARVQGQPAANAAEVFLDEHYGDAVMKRIYPKLVHR